MPILVATGNVLEIYNGFSLFRDFLRLFDGLANFPFTTTETKRSYL